MSDSKSTPDTAERKPVLIRFPDDLHRQVAEHAVEMSKELGGARISFTAAALSLMNDGLKARH